MRSAASAGDQDLRYVHNRWDDDVAENHDPVGRLIYRSNMLGADWRITNTGGGNTSSKIRERDPMTGHVVDVLWVKGSGGDLRTAERANFASLYQSKLMDLQRIYDAFASKGPKTEAEDAMVEMYPYCTFDLNPRAPSIDTPLHAFIPFKHVDHMHPVACIAIATSEDGPRLTRDVCGDEVVWVDWQRPGFELGLTLQEVCRENPNARGIMLGGHGLINWADDDKGCYLLTLRLIDKAAAYLAQNDRSADTFGGPNLPGLSERAGRGSAASRDRASPGTFLRRWRISRSSISSPARQSGCRSTCRGMSLMIRSHCAGMPRASASVSMPLTPTPFRISKDCPTAISSARSATPTRSSAGRR